MAASMNIATINRLLNVAKLFKAEESMTVKMSSDVWTVSQTLGGGSVYVHVPIRLPSPSADKGLVVCINPVALQKGLDIFLLLLARSKATVKVAVSDETMEFHCRDTTSTIPRCIQDGVSEDVVGDIENDFGLTWRLEVDVNLWEILTILRIAKTTKSDITLTLPASTTGKHVLRIEIGDGITGRHCKQLETKRCLDLGVDTEEEPDGVSNLSTALYSARFAYMNISIMVDLFSQVSGAHTMSLLHMKLGIGRPLLLFTGSTKMMVGDKL